MVGARNHGGGVDSGGMAEELGFYARSLATWTCGPHNIAGVTPLPQLLYGAASALPDAIVLLTKSLCTLQALVSNMEESGWQPIETAPKDENVFILAKRAGAQVPFAASYDADFDNWYTFNGALENCGVKFEPTHWMHLSEPGQAVLGTFDLEALKTLVGEIDDVLGGTE